MISKNQLKRMMREGMTDLEIATQLDIKPREVFKTRRRYGFLTDEERSHIFNTRRKLILGGIGVAALAAVEGAIYLLTRPVTYEDALYDERKRQSHIDKIVHGKIPDNVIFVKYATPELLAKLASHGYTPPRSAYAGTIPVVMEEKGDFKPARPEQVGKGVLSIVLVYEAAYEDLYKKFPRLEGIYPKQRLYEDLEAIISNVILSNEFTDAKHFNQGIPGYPVEPFRDSNGVINFKLYNTVIDILSYSAEYSALLANPRIATSEFMRVYAHGIQGLANGFYSLLFNPQITKDMDPKFMQRLRQDFNPQKLFRPLN